MSLTDFSRENIINNPEIELVDIDEENKLELYSYKECSRDSSSFIKQCRGLVYHNGELLMKAYSYVDEYTPNEIKGSRPLGDRKEYTFFPSYEGALLRLFYLNEKWYLSTHRKLDAFNSRWGSQSSFGVFFTRALLHDSLLNPKLAELFKSPGSDEITDENAYEIFLSSLDKTKQYAFLLRSTENRIVSHTSMMEPHLYHVGTFSSPAKESENEDIGVKHPEQLTFPDVDSLANYVNSSDSKKIQGVIGFTQTSQIRIINPEYKRRFELRGNQPNLHVRYFELRNEPEKFKDFLNLYPSLDSWRHQVEGAIDYLTNKIHGAYVQRYIRKEYVVLPQKLFVIMGKCHKWYLEDRYNRKVYPENVLDIINCEKPYDLYLLTTVFLNR